MRRFLLLLVTTFYTVTSSAADVQNLFPDTIEISNYFDCDDADSRATEAPTPDDSSRDDDSWDEMAD